MADWSDNLYSFFEMIIPLAQKERTPRPLGNYPGYSEPFNSLCRGSSRDIYNITVRNIKTGGNHHGVICLATYGKQVYNVSVDGFYETDEGERESTVKIYTGYGDGYNKGDIHDISVKNIYSKAARYAIQIMPETENVTVDNINQEDYFPSVIQGKDGIYIAFDIFSEYAEKGSFTVKEIVCNLIDRLITGKSVITNLPAQGVVTLTKQNNRKIVHLLYASPVRRGNGTEIIEDSIPIQNTEVSVLSSKPEKNIHTAWLCLCMRAV